MNQTSRSFVEKVDFITSVGHLDGGDARKRLGLTGGGPVAVVTDLCLLEPDRVTRELTVTSLHPGITRQKVEASTGWKLRFAPQVAETAPPKSFELETLRQLQRRTALAHGRAPAA